MTGFDSDAQIHANSRLSDGLLPFGVFGFRERRLAVDFERRLEQDEALWGADGLGSDIVASAKKLEAIGRGWWADELRLEFLSGAAGPISSPVRQREEYA